MIPEKVGPIWQGIRYLRDLFLPSSGLMIGENRLHSAKDANGNQDPHWKRQDGTEMNLTGEVKLCRSTADLTLTTSAASITGDGDSSKVRLLLPTIGEWTVIAVCDFNVTVADPDSCIGLLYVNDSGTPESGGVVYGDGQVNRGTVGQQWKVTTTAADTPIELKAYKSTDAGTAKAMSGNTTLSAFIGAGGGSTVETVDHGTLTGRGDDDHTQYGQLADAETVTGIWTFDNGLKTDTISEKTAAAGVTIDSVALKDGGATLSGTLDMGGNEITNIKTATTHVDAAISKFVARHDLDNANVYPQVLMEKAKAGPNAIDANYYLGAFMYLGALNSTPDWGIGARVMAKATENWSVGNVGTELSFWVAANGSAIASERWVIQQDGTLAAISGEAISTSGALGAGETTLADGASLNLQEAITFTGATTENLVEMPDNLADALSFKQGANSYLTFVTTNAGEKVAFGKIFEGVTASKIGNLTLADGSITDSGGSISFGNENLSTTGTLGVTGLTTATGGITSGAAISSDTDDTDDLGTTSKRWGNLHLAHSVVLDPTPDADHESSGVTAVFTANENQAIGDVCYIDANSEMHIADADAIATSYVVGMCADATISANNTGNYLLFGIVRDDTWNWTVGTPIFLTVTGTTTNTLSQTAPSGADDCVVIVGVATHADRMLFNPSPQAIVEHTG